MKMLKAAVLSIMIALVTSASAASPASALKELQFEKLMFFVAGVVESTSEEKYAGCIPENTSLVDLTLVVQRAIVKYPSYLDKPSAVFVKAAIAEVFCSAQQMESNKPQKAPERTL